MSIIFENTTQNNEYKIIYNENGGDYAYPPHWHDEIEIYCSIEGTYTYNLQNTEYTLQSGDLIIVNSSDIHSTCNKDTGNKDLIIQISSDFPTHFGLPTRLPEAHIPYRKLREHGIEEQVKSIIDTLTNVEGYIKHDEITKLIFQYNTDPYTDYLIQLEIAKLWVLLIKAANSKIPDEGSASKISAVLKYIEQHYAEDISLDNISDIMGYSPEHTSKLFKSTLGITYKKYLTTLRIKKACIMLVETNKKINDIYHECGFISQRTFNESFRKQMKCSPEEYRRETHVIVPEDTL